MTALEVSAVARARVDRIKTGTEVLWQLIVESYRARDWESLGYASWDEMCTREFGTSRLRLPREERAETVQSLRDSGLSLRAIAAATGHDVKTIRSDLGQVREIPTPAPRPVPEWVDQETGELLDDEELSWGSSIETDVAAEENEELVRPHPMPDPKPVTGIDGKQYAQTAPVRKPPRKPLVDVAKSRGFAIRQATDSLLKIFEDDRFRTNEKQVADVLRGHLLYVAETVSAVLDQLP